MAYSAMAYSAMTYTSTRREMHVLVVADNPAERSLISEAFASAREASVRVSGTEERNIQAYLDAQEDANTARPELILLSIDAQAGGFDVLTRIKMNPALRLIPVVVFTNADCEEQIREAYTRHANCCIIRPSDAHQFLKTLAAVREFWLCVAKRPNMRCASASA